MHLILCVDDRNGMSFCGKRQSSDRCVTEDILMISAGKLWMNGYSAKLFPEGAALVDENFLDKAGQGEFCFAETTPLPARIQNLESVILYRWNRHYPSTLKFPLSIVQPFTLAETREFSGNSHEKITVERYTL